MDTPRPWLPSLGLTTTGTPMSCGRLPGIFGAVDDATFGHRHAAGWQQLLGQVLVAGDAFGDGAGRVGLGGPDAALARAVAELHQVAVGQADRRDAAVGGRIDDVGGAGAEAEAVHQVAQTFGTVAGTSNGVSLIAAMQQVARGVQRGAGDLFLARAHHHLVDAALRRCSRVLPKPVCMPARFCSSSVTCSRMWPAQVPSRRRCRKPPRSPTPQRCSTSDGSQAVRRS